MSEHLLRREAPVQKSFFPPPILRWAGSKRSAAQSLASFWRDGSRYIEPFCGSAALFFAIRPNSAVLSDINEELIAFYQTSAISPLLVYEQFLRIPRRRETYDAIRKTYMLVDNPIERAAAFYFLNRNCFNGLFRTNKSGMFNVPFSGNRVARYLTEYEFMEACKLLSNVRFLSGDFGEIILEHVKKGDFVYIDPPYASSARLPFREYHRNSFSVNDLARLSDILIEIDRRDALFVLSYDDGEAIRDIQERWNSQSYSVRRNISGFCAGRRISTEQIITNI